MCKLLNHHLMLEIQTYKPSRNYWLYWIKNLPKDNKYIKDYVMNTKMNFQSFNKFKIFAVKHTQSELIESHIFYCIN